MMMMRMTSDVGGDDSGDDDGCDGGDGGDDDDYDGGDDDVPGWLHNGRHNIQDAVLKCYDQLTNYLEKLGYFSNPPKKSGSNFFWVAQDLILVQLILIMQKLTKKSLFGHF